jgi:hypothetical protein
MAETQRECGGCRHPACPQCFPLGAPGDRLPLSPYAAQRACGGGQEAHEAHMALNGECPWCGYADPSAIDPNVDPEDF